MASMCYFKKSSLNLAAKKMMSNLRNSLTKEKNRKTTTCNW